MSSFRAIHEPLTVNRAIVGQALKPEIKEVEAGWVLV
jgi:hypothetical protein